MDDSFKVVIPARYASTRLPGKPLRMVAGKTLLERVHARAAAAGVEVVIATDDARIATEGRRCGARVCMTAADHPSGTSRLAEVVGKLGWSDETVVVNLQGDEPLMPPALLRAVADDLAAHPRADIATLACPIEDAAELADPNAVKVVTDADGFALYFSRAPIPWDRDGAPAAGGAAVPGPEHRRHLGLYAYRAGFLRRFVGLAPSPLEALESLEQLRVLWHGGRIHVAMAGELPGPGIDTEHDLARVERLLAATGEV